MSEIRRDPITGHWVILATERASRPNEYQTPPAARKSDLVCPFCPGNEHLTPPEILANRDGGAPNGPGWRFRVVPNKFPALRRDAAHEVFIEGPDHDQRLSEASVESVARLLGAIGERIRDLRRDSQLRHVVVFKNQGEAAGATIEHPHCQLLALPIVPKQISDEIEHARQHHHNSGRCIYCETIQEEAADRTRAVLETDQFLVFAPYAARLPYETWIAPKRHQSHFESQTIDLAETLRETLRRIDSTLHRPPLNMVLHTAPLQETALPHYHWRIELIPKLGKTAGFEWATGCYINPVPPEQAAETLRTSR